MVYLPKIWKNIGFTMFCIKKKLNLSNFSCRLSFLHCKATPDWGLSMSKSAKPAFFSWEMCKFARKGKQQ